METSQQKLEKKRSCSTDLDSVNFPRTGQWEDNQDELICWCFCNQDTVIPNDIQVFDDRARSWSKQGHPGVLGRLRQRSLDHLG